MENTPTGRADDLLPILGIFKNVQNREASTFVSAAGFLTIWDCSLSGGLQADLLGCLGVGAPQEKGKLHFACECGG